MKNLYNLSYQDEYYISTVNPNRLPVDDFSLVEITYNDEIVVKVVGTYCYDNKQENIILSDLEIMKYLEMLKGKCEIVFQGDSDVENKNEKVFLLMICSYLSYFSFMKFPFDLTLDLLDNKAFKYFTSFIATNEIENSWIRQVSYLHKNFRYLFPSEFDENADESEEDDIIDDVQFSDVVITKEIKEENITKEIKEENITKEIKEENITKEIKEENISRENNNITIVPKEEDDMIRELTKKYVKEYAKDYVKGYMKEYFDKKIGEIEIISTQSIEKINQEAENISKDVKEFKRRLLKDISKNH